MERLDLINLTADIVASHVSNNAVPISDVQPLIEGIHEALAALGRSSDPRPAPREPIVSVRSSLNPDALTCLICGKKQKLLRRHLHNAHGISPDEYRLEFDLPVSYPMTAPDYSETRRQLAVAMGLGKLPVKTRRGGRRKESA